MKRLQCTKSLSTSISLDIIRRATWLHLINKILAVIIAQVLRPDNAMKICLHEFLYKEHFREIFDAWRLENIKDCDDVFMAKVTEEFDLAKSAQTKHGMIKRSNFLDSDMALGPHVHC
jgi:hypothetical protein